MMNKEGNSYTLVYASIVVILVAVALAFVSQTLRPQQAKNEAIDKMQQILGSLHVTTTGANAEMEYKKLITDSYVVNVKGEKIEGDAFVTEPAEELNKPESERKYPVYEAMIDGKKKYILSMRGTGLWGPIWGFMALNDDKNTVYGASFGHAGETPGLGAEIDKPAFGKEFIGKKFFNHEGQFVSIAIVKPGKIAQGKDYVDGISGGTITSQGVDAMLSNSIGAYHEFLKK
ncbi:MAG: NADH:ubiquinone reductase (Na(+)-transporting) subunit C [Dysgonamonadaceae bacterium]|jgi:Na+-transporting NADH:ubiquinone oxidoreductase subunit C|nr:NADH:ubiquinone reductase (Na(+)-transporting) subunit C [Dysgonamonadaceae bacterium]